MTANASTQPSKFERIWSVSGLLTIGLLSVFLFSSPHLKCQVPIAILLSSLRQLSARQGQHKSCGNVIAGMSIIREIKCSAIFRQSVWQANMAAPDFSDLSMNLVLHSNAGDTATCVKCLQQDGQVRMQTPNKCWLCHSTHLLHFGELTWTAPGLHCLTPRVGTAMRRPLQISHHCFNCPLQILTRVGLPRLCSSSQTTSLCRSAKCLQTCLRTASSRPPGSLTHCSP